MSLPNSANPQCPDCGKPSRRKRTNQDGRKIYDCVCGWSNTVKRIPRSLLKRKELNAIAIQAAIELYSQDTYRGSYIDLSEIIGGDRWLYSGDALVKDFKKFIENGKSMNPLLKLEYSEKNSDNAKYGIPLFSIRIWIKKQESRFYVDDGENAFPVDSIFYSKKFGWRIWLLQFGINPDSIQTGQGGITEEAWLGWFDKNTAKTAFNTLASRLKRETSFLVDKDEYYQQID